MKAITAGKTMGVTATATAAAIPAKRSWRAVATELLKVYALQRGYRLQAMDPAKTQTRQMLKLVTAAAATRFGRDHDFASIRTVEDFQKRVPLRTFNQLWDEYWKEPFPNLVDVTWPGKMPYFAVSSGTASGKVKHIPCSREMIRSNRQAALDLLTHHIRNRPKTRIFDGKCFLLGGSTDLTEHAPGVKSGDISGIQASEKPEWTQHFYFPPLPVTLITEWEQKIDTLARLSLDEDIRFLSGAPGWMLILFEKLAALRPGSAGRVADFFPNLEMLTHGGVGFAPYRTRYEALLAGSRADLREVYPASEGFVAIADRGPGEGLRLNLDIGMFFEFVPVDELGSANPTRHWVGTIETGIDYAIVLNTCAGLWGYVIGDVVRFVDRDPPRLLISGRTSYSLSSFGEHLTGDLVESAVLAAAEDIGAVIAEYAVGTAFGDRGGALGHHIYVVECADEMPSPERIDRFGRFVDRFLMEANDDYRERRVIALGVREPVIRAVPPGTFAQWMKSRGKLGGQNKVPRVISDANLLRNLLDFTETTH